MLLGLLAGLRQTNGWTIAEHVGEASPDRMQHLLARACWDADALRDDLRGYVIDHLADPGAVPRHLIHTHCARRLAVTARRPALQPTRPP